MGILRVVDKVVMRNPVAIVGGISVDPVVVCGNVVCDNGIVVRGNGYACAGTALSHRESSDAYQVSGHRDDIAAFRSVYNRALHTLTYKMYLFIHGYIFMVGSIVDIDETAFCHAIDSLPYGGDMSRIVPAWISVLIHKDRDFPRRK